MLPSPTEPPAALPARFWSKVNKTPTCWLWTANTAANGYGRFWMVDRSKAAHRLAYEDARGPIPDGLQLDHLCRVRNCVNPDHLEPVTGQVNCHRGIAPSAENVVKTHCPKMHPYDLVNTYQTPRGRRECRACRSAGFASRNQVKLAQRRASR